MYISFISLVFALPESLLNFPSNSKHQGSSDESQICLSVQGLTLSDPDSYTQLLRDLTSSYILIGNSNSTMHFNSQFPKSFLLFLPYPVTTCDQLFKPKTWASSSTFLLPCLPYLTTVKSYRLYLQKSLSDQSTSFHLHCHYPNLNHHFLPGHLQ